MKTIALALRGHERSSFSNPNLRGFVTSLVSRDDIEIDIYVQTWNMSDCRKSWRPTQKTQYQITEARIKEYFGEVICARIKSIIILDEDNIELLGNLDGNLGRTLLPIKSWKNMWMGKYRLSEEILFHGVNYEFVLNMRLDHFLCIFNKRMGVTDVACLYSFINKLLSHDFTTSQCVLINNKRIAGIDNIYACSTNFFENMCSEFYTNLDDILKIFTIRTNQEFLVVDYINKYASFDSCIPTTHTIV